MERWDFCASLAHDGAYQLLTPEGERVGPDDLTMQQTYCLVLALNLREHRVGAEAVMINQAVTAYQPPPTPGDLGSA